MLVLHNTARGILAAASVFTVLALTAPAMSQPFGGGRGWEPGVMMGPGMMGRIGELCGPRAAGMAEWRMERITRVITPTAEQKTALNNLLDASRKAAEIVSSACPRELPGSATARMALMESRLEAMLQAVKTVRPAFDAFYGTLSDEQKARLNTLGPRRWGWRGWRDDRPGRD